MTRISSQRIFSRVLFLTSVGAVVSLPFLFGATDGQQDDEKAPPATQFEVAAIKPADPKIPNMRFMFGPGGTFEGAKLTLKFLIQQAYGLRDSQISGGPAWLDSDTFDIKAKANGSLFGADIRRGPFQKLLADRFQLTFHKSTKDMTYYALVVAKGGPKFKESTDERSAGMRARGGSGLLDGPSITMAQIVEHLAHSVQRVIVDQTGLKGRYKLKLEWSEESGPGDDGAAEAAPPLIRALQDQLGLKLETRKGPVEILVVDRAQKPSAN